MTTIAPGLTRAASAPEIVLIQESNLAQSKSPTPLLLAQAAYEAELWQLTNKERAKVGVPPLQLNSHLGQAAQSHAEDMAKNGFFSHTGSNGSSTQGRVEAAGYAWQKIAENIAAGQTTPQETVEAWMDSPVHKSHILDPELKEIGFGYARNYSSVHKHYWSQLFGTPSI
ncbi:CAP domain-containing protein [Lyngbya aestuarii]|uniref:CAP domain-containing protein n=1 Tax=Lyngbya aestuarii TaxID=118322 RepID=UPI00403DA971